MPRTFVFVLITFLSHSAFVAHNASAHDGHDHSSESAKTDTARGIVFEDVNRNGVHDNGERGLPDVRVSNGGEIVTSGADGRYEIPVDDDEIIFVIKPRDWATPLSENNLPRFYYIHKPAGSPAGTRFPGVAPTGPLPKSIDFAMHPQSEPDQFKVIMFGDPQSRDVAEVEYMAHDVIEQIIANDAHDASFGVTLGDIVFDDLDVMEPHNQAVALIGIPWYNVIGNHDLNREAKTDSESDETFEDHYGPAYYSFDHGAAHFMVLDDVEWLPAEGNKRAHYEGGLGPRQMEFIRNDLAGIPEDQLVVLMMHVPLNNVKDRQELYRLIEQRPASVSLSAHTHYMEHRFIGTEDGWQGEQKHHHIVNVTVCGSWWTGQRDERGIPHATMSDGGPNGYTVMEFDGDKYTLSLKPASRPADHQMKIYAPETVAANKLESTKVLVNVFNGMDATKVELSVGRSGEWKTLKQTLVTDPDFVAHKIRELSIPDRKFRDLPGPHRTPHMWIGNLPAGLSTGTHLIKVRSTNPGQTAFTNHRVIRVTTPSPETASTEESK